MDSFDLLRPHTFEESPLPSNAIMASSDEDKSTESKKELEIGNDSMEPEQALQDEGDSMEPEQKLGNEGETIFPCLGLLQNVS